MYQCANCGGELRFDIASQKVKCSSCSSLFDPKTVLKTDDAEEDNFYDVTVFHCPQCGGEITATENTVADFCSFCGASTILSARMERSKKPSYIIPFKKTKDDCKKAYAAFARKSLYTPNEYKDAKFIDGFRGIYMPYWSYYVRHDGKVSLGLEKSHRSGDYIITDHYRLSGDVDGYYKGLSYDAASSFNDEISETIAPYDAHEMEVFEPSYLLGFYGDTADVPSTTYDDKVRDIARDETLSKIKKQAQTFSYSYSNSRETQMKGIPTKIEKVDSTMFPVWFMSYRKHNRVAYATVNGQTGKVFADMPVSIWKFLIGTILMAIPIFLLLSGAFEHFHLIPTQNLFIVMIAAFITLIMFDIEMTEIVKSDSGVYDWGMLYAKQKARKEREKKDPKFAEANKKKPTSKIVTREDKTSTSPGLVIFLVLLFSVIFTAVGALFVDFMITEFSDGYSLVLGLVVLVLEAIGAAIFAHSSKTLKTIPVKANVPGSLFSLISLAIGMVIFFADPANDIYYYFATVLSLVSMFITMMSMMVYYNVLATRPLPQFTNYDGGDDRA
ncbi:MAG: hypothetical protein K6G11_06385 [Lachnospiraceae bacterium]|nr:hypothetical protein [Lachnospiraceae bacterium]